MTFKPPAITIATFNRGKVAEFTSMLDGAAVRFRTLDEFGDIPEVAETGATFAENAELKASGYALATGTITLADDSGLEVAALDGRPGVMSARYGGDGLSYADRMRLILRELESAGGDRRACFVCSIAVADSAGNLVQTARGMCTGTIAPAPRGDAGFGYDPIFIPDGYDLTFGELSGAVKHAISHRARAFTQIIPFLRGNTAV